MPSFSHIAIYVNDMDESINFYTRILGFALLDEPLHLPGNADMAFVGRDWNSYVQLIYDLEVHPPYEFGSRFEHIAIAAGRDLAAYVAELKEKGVKVLKEVRKSPIGTNMIAFIEDPNGIPIELF